MRTIESLEEFKQLLEEGRITLSGGYPIGAYSPCACFHFNSNYGYNRVLHILKFEEIPHRDVAVGYVQIHAELSPQFEQWLYSNY